MPEPCDFVTICSSFSVRHDLLDVGCGTGEFCQEASKLGWNAVGIELTDDAATVARIRTGLPIISGDITKEALFPSASFDLITLWGVLEHVSDPETLLWASKRLLRRGGLILLETPNVLGLFRLAGQILLKLTFGHFDKPFKETLGAGHVLWYSPLGLQTTCQRLGLKVIDMRGSRNYTGILLDRFKHLSFPNKYLFKTGTVFLNHLAIPIGVPNQIIAAISGT
jgi:2-polyprenyl-3-methyl-5-hydroxy-6-metoxy-1,4-benzoquinol methylase